MEIQTLSNNVDDRLLQLLMDNFNSDEQQIFIQNFQIYLQYSNDDRAFVIDFDKIWEYIGFTRRDNAKRLFIKSFESNVDFESTHILEYNNKEIILMSVGTFKEFCIVANTEKAKITRKYYLKMENIMLKYLTEKFYKVNAELQESIVAKHEIEKKLGIERHHILLQTYQNKTIVYIMKIITDTSFDNNQYIIKIGRTTNINERIMALTASFKCKMIVSDVFCCDESHNFEQFIHKHPVLQIYKYTDLVNNAIKSTETYLVTDKVYRKIIRLMNETLPKYNINKEIKLMQLRIQEKEAENKLAEINLKSKEIDYKNAIISMSTTYDNALQLLQARDEEVSNKLLSKLTEDIVNKITSKTTNENQIQQEKMQQNYVQQELLMKKMCGEILNLRKEIMALREIHGPDQEQEKVEEKEDPSPQLSDVVNKPHDPENQKVQLYDENEPTKLIRVFESITEANKEMKSTSMKVRSASKDKTIYLGYRWYIVDSNNPDAYNVIDIGPTTVIPKRNSGFIAMMDNKNVKVIKVFINQKQGAKFIQQDGSAMSGAIKYTQTLGGHYWAVWNDLNKEQQDAYLLLHNLPKK